MIDLNNIKQQLNLSRKAVSEIKNQNRIFDVLLQEAVKGAPKEDQKTIEEIRILSKNAINLAKKGNIEEAQNLINKFNYVGKNHK